MIKQLYILIVLLIASLQIHAAEYIVKQKSFGAKSMMAIQGMNVLEHHRSGNLTLVDVDKDKETKVLAEILNHPDVEYAVPNIRVHRFGVPLQKADFANLREQWANSKVNLDKAWQLGGEGSKEVTIAVIDTGVDYNHESLSTNMVPGYDFKDNDNNPMDETSARNPGHGTHCTGSIAGNGLVSNGIKGAIPKVSIMPIRFLGADGSGSLMDSVKAIDYAIENGADILSNSWGAAVSASQAKPIIEAVERADKAGAIFIAAAANNGASNDKTSVYPANANFANTITVAASGPDDSKPSWSNFGKKTVHVAAPGLDIMSTLPQNKYGNLSGTSMATPLVSGIVGLIKSVNPNLSGAEIKALLQTTGAKVDIETACDCRVDAGSAVESLLNKDMILVPAAAALAIDEKVQVSVMNGEEPFTFSSADEAIATVSADGLVSGVAEGMTKISVKDATGKTFQSLDYVVGNTDSGGGNPGECPLGNPQLCEILCGIQPDLPFCN